MITTPERPSDNPRYAEYVLGALDSAERAEIEREIESNPTAAAAVAWWQGQLTTLAEDIPAVTPPAYVLARIESELGFASPLLHTPLARTNPTRLGWWNNLPLWRWLGIGASVVAAACLALLVINPQRAALSPPTQNEAASYMVATLSRDNGVASWTATMDLQRSRILIVPASPEAMASAHSPELWLITPGQQPISIGVIVANKPTTLNLSPALLAKLSAKALLAVSVEPRGGSPTGLPTGPVIAKGNLSGA